MSENELYRNRLGKAVYFTNDPDSKGYLTGTFSKADLRQFVNDKDLLNSKEVMKNISCCLYELPELKRHRCFFLPNAITPEDELDAREIGNARRPRVTEACLRILEYNLHRRDKQDNMLNKREVHVIGDDHDNSDRPSKKRNY